MTLRLKDTQSSLLPCHERKDLLYDMYSHIIKISIKNFNKVKY